MKIVVASSIKSQYDFLKKQGLPVIYDKSILDNKFQSLSPEEYGQDLVNNFLKQTSPKYKNVFFTAFASFIVYRGRHFAPPRYKMNALEYLELLSGHTFSAVTTYALKNQRYHDVNLGMVETKITLKPMTKNQCTDYVNDHDVVSEPFLIDVTDTYTQSLITQIDGSLNNLLYKLPLESLDLEKIKKGII